MSSGCCILSRSYLRLSFLVPSENRAPQISCYSEPQTRSSLDTSRKRERYMRNLTEKNLSSLLHQIYLIIESRLLAWCVRVFYFE